MKYLIKDGRLIDPANKVDVVLDILISGGKIEKIAKDIKNKNGAKIIDAKGKIIAPGLIDMHVHLREPGREDKETVETGTRAALCGGVASICAMPNTEPSIDTRIKAQSLNEIIKKTAVTNVFIVGAITKGRDGKELADIEGMEEEGVIAISDDGNCVQDIALMFEALKTAKNKGLVLISHCEDTKVSGKGVINEGVIATRLGLKPMPKKAEFEIVKRDIDLAKKSGAKLHIAHISCKESIEYLKKAKKEGVDVSAEVTPHHFVLSDECCLTYDTNTKMNPPLRSKEDVASIKAALADGTIDVIASDHAPHGKHEKEIPFDNAAFGIIGLETSLALAIANLVQTKVLSWGRLVELMSLGPARILGLNKKGALSEGNDADITIIDPEKEWIYTESSIQSKSKNSPFINWKFKGKAVSVITGGELVMEDGKIYSHK
ncbi:MAG: dihydroorotase [Candidatus Omnitrophica bacterium CG07_land_8_20_14_0_80_42_15]|uniref:Dihydroorotase n=1 Tax=Candidatus Aquitaenariimonas noxiae TaxID=1974741 RepID=A0A2J0KSR8_9BACT|nr:MAG: dihydroorotase [Candidatus Omnitrophica bacterium CG07_land_8_20_14_0_80_42_15]